MGTTTRVKPVHTGQHTNGVGGCMARWANHGHCPGEAQAAWLNAIGDDDTPYGGTTAGQVRRNWANIPSISHVTFDTEATK